MNKRSNDYIPYESEIIAQHEAIKEYQATHKDPRKKYSASYTVNGANLSSELLALTTKDAEDQLKQQLGQIGWYPINIVITEIQE